MGMLPGIESILSNHHIEIQIKMLIRQFNYTKYCSRMHF